MCFFVSFPDRYWGPVLRQENLETVNEIQVKRQNKLNNSAQGREVLLFPLHSDSISPMFVFRIILVLEIIAKVSVPDQALESRYWTII